MIETFSLEYPDAIQIKVGENKEERAVVNKDTGYIYSKRLSKYVHYVLDGNFNFKELMNPQYKDMFNVYDKIFELGKNSEGINDVAVNLEKFANDIQEPEKRTNKPTIATPENQERDKND